MNVRFLVSAFFLKMHEAQAGFTSRAVSAIHRSGPSTQLVNVYYQQLHLIDTSTRSVNRRLNMNITDVDSSVSGQTMKSIFVTVIFGLLICSCCWHLNRKRKNKDGEARCAAQEEGAVVQIPNRIKELEMPKDVYKIKELEMPKESGDCGIEPVFLETNRYRI